LNTPRTSSAGRLFDAIAALIGLRQVCRFEGQAAMELEYAVSEAGSDRSFPFELRETGEGVILDWEPMIRAILKDSASAGSIALAVHNTLVRMIVAVAQRVTESSIRHLRKAGFGAYWHQRIPPNDGGIALGQVMGAVTALRKDGSKGF
jgi:hydrogenase maturation protein HypF